MLPCIVRSILIKFLSCYSFSSVAFTAFRIAFLFVAVSFSCGLLSIKPDAFLTQPLLFHRLPIRNKPSNEIFVISLFPSASSLLYILSPSFVILVFSPFFLFCLMVDFLNSTLSLFGGVALTFTIFPNVRKCVRGGVRLVQCYFV